MTAVSRSVYQKVCEENKRLLKDIKILSNGLTSDKIICINKWRKKFKDDDDFNELLRSASKEYIQLHKDELPDFLTKLKHI